MRLGQLILLASLAQLLGLPALAAALSEHPAFTEAAGASNQTARHLLPAAPMETISHGAAKDRSASQAVLALTALAETPLWHSVWMVAPAVRTVAVPRPRRFTLLRC